jgi:hypothetical protein
MRLLRHLSLLVCLLCFLQPVQSQTTVYRYASTTDSRGCTFYALEGTIGQLFYMNDYGDDAAIWKRYGNVLRAAGRNNLQFAALGSENGTVFYALEGNSGQLHFMLDFGDMPGAWKAYGEPIRLFGDETLLFTAAKEEQGAKFTAIDANNGQVYYMFDYGERAGRWRTYGGIIK